MGKTFRSFATRGLKFIATETTYFVSFCCFNKVKLESGEGNISIMIVIVKTFYDFTHLRSVARKFCGVIKLPCL